MAQKVFNFETSFDRTANTMVHTINDSIKVLTDFRTLKITVFKNDKAVNSYDGRSMTLSDYGKVLQMVAESAETVKSFEVDGQ